MFSDSENGRFYLFDVAGVAEIKLECAAVEAVVADKLKITPVLDGPMFHLRFSSPGGGFEDWEEWPGPYSLLDLVDEFIEESELKTDSPQEYQAALASLEKYLKKAVRNVRMRLDQTSPAVDPFAPDYMPSLSEKLKELGISK
jgi:hypothetical protein